MDKRTALTYIDSDGSWHRASKGAPEQVTLTKHNFIYGVETLLDRGKLFSFIILWEQILALCNSKEDVKKKVHSVIEKFAERGLRSLAVARQVGTHKSSYTWCRVN